MAITIPRSAEVTTLITKQVLLDTFYLRHAPGPKAKPIVLLQVPVV